MNKLFSRAAALASLKHGLCALTLASTCLFAGNASAQYVHTSGTKIVDEKGAPLYLSGMNLGNWLLWEGYLMMGDFNYRTHTQFLNSLGNAFGDAAKAKEFEHQWRLNYVTEQTIIDLKNLGYNSVRVPFHYNMFWQNGALSNAGFQYLDRLVGYCKTHKIYILLDMHAAPGYQNPGDHSDNMDSNSSQPRTSVKFWDGNNISIASQVWKHIANYYKNEPIIWGYDLINEPVTQPNRSYELLTSLITMRNAIREVDNNHIIVAEGDWWASDLNVLDWTNGTTQNNTGISSRWDNNLVIETHHYIFGNTAALADLYARDDITNRMGVPLILGEYGEDTAANLRTMADWSAANIAGSFAWSFKKMSHDKTLWTVMPNSVYSSVVNAINSNTSAASAYTGMIDFAKTNILNGAAGLVWHQDFYDGTKPACNVSGTRTPFNTTPYTIPGTIEAENFDLGCQGLTWWDSSSGNSGNAYRTTEVDISATNDNGVAGYNIGWVAQGEWLEYSVNVQQAGSYNLSYRVATPQTTGQIQFLLNGQLLSTTSTPATGGWDTWASVNSSNVTLPTGNQIVRIYFSGAEVNLNNFTLTLANASSSRTSSSVSSSKTSSSISSSISSTTSSKTSSATSTSKSSSSSSVVSTSKSSSSSSTVSGIISGRSYAIISKNSGKALDVTNNSTSNGTSIQQWTFSGAANQLWTLTQLSGTTYKIISNSSGKSLDVAGVSTSNGATIQQWDFTNAGNQHWILTDLGNGYFKIVAEHSGKSLDVKDVSVNDGAGIQQWDYSGSNNQQWQLQLK